MTGNSLAFIPFGSGPIIQTICLANSVARPWHPFRISGKNIERALNRVKETHAYRWEKEPAQAGLWIACER